MRVLLPAALIAMISSCAPTHEGSQDSASACPPVNHISQQELTGPVSLVKQTNWTLTLDFDAPDSLRRERDGEEIRHFNTDGLIIREERYYNPESLYSEEGQGPAKDTVVLFAVAEYVNEKDSLFASVTSYNPFTSQTEGEPQQKAYPQQRSPEGIDTLFADGAGNMLIQYLSNCQPDTLIRKEGPFETKSYLLYNERGHASKVIYSTPDPTGQSSLDTIIYNYIMIDAYGNWTEREVYSATDNSNVTLQTRYIEYRQ
jgi:hypothetical protein